MEAARWFISGSQRQEASRQLNQDCDAFGIAIRKPAAEKAVFEVDAENAVVWDLFLGLSGDWRIGPSGAMGIGKTAMKSLFELRGIHRERWPDLSAALAAMEREALSEIDAMNSKATRQAQ